MLVILKESEADNDTALIVNCWLDQAYFLLPNVPSRETYIILRSRVGEELSILYFVYLYRSTTIVQIPKAMSK